MVLLMAKKNSKKNLKKRKVDKSKPSLLIIGSRRYKKATVQALLKEAKTCFGRVLFVPIHKIKFVADGNDTKLYYKDRELSNFDVCYPRLSSSNYFLAEPLLRVIEQSKMYTPVSLEGFQWSNHKFYTVRQLVKAEIPVLPSSLFVSPNAAKQAVNRFGFPVVLKLISGFAGKGVMLIENEKELKSILETVTLFEDYVSAQKFVPNTSSDYRAYVIGEKVISVKRSGRKSEWRANVSRGGQAKVVKLPKDVERIAIQAARFLKFDICAVDFIETKSFKEGYAIIEVNFMPGPFKKYLGDKVPKEMVKFLYKKALEKKKKII